jgi:SAM-dependent methyltransferase
MVGNGIMFQRGDSERQAFLRNKAAKEQKTVNVGPDTHAMYITGILSKAKSRCKVLDVGCGTAHVTVELAEKVTDVFSVGLDLSSAMLNVARKNIVGFSNIHLLKGDGMELPFEDETFDIVLDRLAEYSLKEVYRVLKSGGIFFEFGLGPDNDKEILALFPDRFAKDAFFSLQNRKEWVREVVAEKRRCGFSEAKLMAYKGKSYYAGVDDLMDLIEMVPLVKDFDRERDREKILEFSKESLSRRGIPMTYHFFILEAVKP